MGNRHRETETETTKLGLAGTGTFLKPNLVRIILATVTLWK
jgi:hypothetical protein